MAGGVGGWNNFELISNFGTRENSGKIGSLHRQNQIIFEVLKGA